MTDGQLNNGPEKLSGTRLNEVLNNSTRLAHTKDQHHYISRIMSTTRQQPINTCTFPDSTRFTLQREVELSGDYVQVAYLDDGLLQELWVPAGFLGSEGGKSRKTD